MAHLAEISGLDAATLVAGLADLTDARLLLPSPGGFRWPADTARAMC